ncbi:annexin A9 [Cricetulus griseus]
MSVSSGTMGASLTQEILSSLGLANKTAAWGTLGTLRTFLSFSVDKDVQKLLKAITGQGVAHSTIVDVLTNRSREQRQLISRAFQERTKQASGSAKDVALEILATRAAPRLQECLAVYKHDFQVEAQEDIRTETNGILQDLLLALSKGGRERYSGVIDYSLEERDVQVLQQTGGSSMAGQWVLIFTQRSPEHLIRVSIMRNTALYFANKLHQALQVRGTLFPVPPFRSKPGGPTSLPRIYKLSCHG